MQRLKKYITKPWLICLVAMVCCSLWGSAFPVIKLGYGVMNVDPLDYKSQILFAGIRFTLAGVLTVLIGSVIAKRMIFVKPSGAYKIGTLALFQTILQYLFFYIGLASTTGTKSSIIDSTSVFFSVIIASVILKQERFSPRKLIGCVLGFLGVVIINLTSGFDMELSFTGEGFIMLSALAYAISSVMIKQFSKDENPVALSGYQFILGGAIMIIVGLVLGGHLEFNGKGVLITLYLAMVSAVAYTLWGTLLKYNEVSRVTIFGFLTPVFGCLLSALLIGESLVQSGVKTLLALALVCAGIYIVNNTKIGDTYESKNNSSQGI